MAPPICLFNTKGMRRAKCANSPPRPLIHPPATPSFKRHFGCIPDVRDVIHQTAPYRQQLHKNGRDVWIIFLGVWSLSHVSVIIILHYQHEDAGFQFRIKYMFVFCNIFSSSQAYPERFFFFLLLATACQSPYPWIIASWNLSVLTRQWMSNNDCHIAPTVLSWDDWEYIVVSVIFSVLLCLGNRTVPMGWLSYLEDPGQITVFPLLHLSEPWWCCGLFGCRRMSSQVGDVCVCVSARRRLGALLKVNQVIVNICSSTVGQCDC